MAKASVANFGKPTESREFPKGRVEILKFGNSTAGKAVLQPGWKWSTCMKPTAKTESCQAGHFQYHISGVLRVVMDDGQEVDCKAGDVSWLPPGHDAWVVGDEPVVLVDFSGMLDWAKQK